MKPYIRDLIFISKDNIIDGKGDSDIKIIRVNFWVKLTKFKNSIKLNFSAKFKLLIKLSFRLDFLTPKASLKIAKLR